jgi:virginiamycin B lyase
MVRAMTRAVWLLALLLVSCSAQPPANVTSASPAPSAPAASTLDPKATASLGAGDPTPGVNTGPQGRLEMTEYPVGRGQGPHDVAPATDGGVWYTAQRTGELGHLDPKTGATRMVKLGTGSSPHGVIVGPDGAPWVTDSGLNAIVRVDPATSEVKRFGLPGPNVNLNTAAFDRTGTLWFTGQSGYYGYLRDGVVTVLPSPRGAGPYGIATCPDGSVFYASLAASFIGRIDLATARVEVVEPPTKAQGARRVWCDSVGRVWVSEWNVGRVAVYGPSTSGPPIERPNPTPYTPTTPPFSYGWVEWMLPGASPMAYAVYVDDQDIVWLTDFGANAIVRFDPRTQSFTSLPHPQPNAAVRQLLGRPGEVWGAMSGQDKLVVIRTR